MKRMRSILAIVGYSVLMPGAGFAGAPGEAGKPAALVTSHPARLPVGVGTIAIRPVAVPSRTAPAAAVGAMAAPSAKHSAAAVDGAAIKRKP